MANLERPLKVSDPRFDDWLYRFWKLINTGSSPVVVQDNIVRPVSLGGTGAVSLSGYLKGNGTSPFTAVSGIPYSDLTGVPANPSLSANVTALVNTPTAGLYAITAYGTSATRTITGTTNRLTVTNGDGVSGNPTLDVSTSYAGQNTIVTVGTVTTGTWNAGAVTSSGAVLGTNITVWSAFTPSRTGWTDVGSPTVTGRKCQVGNVCHFQVKVIPGTTVATVAGTSYIALPIAAAAASFGGDGSMTDATNFISVGNCVFDITNSRVYVPSQAATADSLIIAGWYEV